ncbi:MAG: PH domain-containing protein, partial [Gammaproteobacteria bacterium]
MMSYIDNNLMSDEKVLYRAKPHWIIFWPTLFFLLLSLALYAFGLKQPLLNAPFTIHLSSLMARLALILAIILAMPEFITYATSEYGLTNKRVLMKTGLFRRISLDIRLTRVESIAVQQTLLGQLLDYGSILISGVGG